MMVYYETDNSHDTSHSHNNSVSEELIQSRVGQQKVGPETFAIRIKSIMIFIELLSSGLKQEKLKQECSSVARMWFCKWNISVLIVQLQRFVKNCKQSD